MVVLNFIFSGLLTNFNLLLLLIFIKINYHNIFLKQKFLEENNFIWLLKIKIMYMR